MRHEPPAADECVVDWSVPTAIPPDIHPAVSVLRMALGDRDAAPRSGAEWWAIYRIAIRERCAALIWLRCGDLVRSQAPDELIRVWRAAVVRQYDRGEALLTRFGRSSARLLGQHVPHVVLKGAPLAAHLYGDPFVRPMDDVDLLVPRAHWARAAAILEQDGWAKEQGRRGWSEIYRLVESGETFRVDMQSSILVDHLAHLPEVRGTIGPWRWGGFVFPTHVGPEGAVLLAVHLLKHQLPPLLWLIDFHAYWSGMSADERNAATRAAAASRAQRYLEWAVTRSSLLLQASRGESTAARKLGFYPSFRRDDYGMLRLTRLAASVPDMVAVLGAWAWPRPLRYDWNAFSRMWRRRGGKSIARVFAARRLYLDPQDRSDLDTAVAVRNHPRSVS